MRDRALDGSADRTDLVIVFVFTRVEFTVLWLLSRRDVARPLKSLVCDNRSGKVENLLHLAFPLLHVMVTSGSRLRDEDNAPEFVADNQAAMTGSLIFPGPHLGGALPRPAWVAVGTALTGGPPRRSQRAGLPHWAPALGVWRRSGRWGRDAWCGVAVATGRRSGASASS